ncbi:MAG: hypothetical protein AAF721_15055 [Myxococcota bacterium]
MSGLATAVRIVVGAPLLWVGIAIAQWLAAKLASVPTIVAVSAAVEGYGPGTRPESVERVLAVVAEVVIAEPSVLAVLVVSVGVAAVVSAIVWTVLSGAVIARYALADVDRAPSRHEVGGRWAATLPAVVVQTLWHWLLRVAAVVAAATAVGSLPDPALAIVTGITLLVSAVALDLARAGVVTEQASRFHPRTAARAFTVALRTPGLLLPAVGLAAAGWLAAGVTAMAALWSLSDPGWLWGARAATAVGLAFVLVRLAFVARHPATADLVKPPERDSEADPEPDPEPAG